MAAPTFVSTVGIVYSSGTTPKTVSVTTATGDALVICASSEGNPAITLPTGGTPTYTAGQDLGFASYAKTRLDHAITGITSQTYTLSQTTDSGTTQWGNTVFRFSGVASVGTAVGTNLDPGAGAGPTLNITTTGANSAIVVVCTDWNATDGASRVWRTVNSITPTAANTFERTYYRDAARYVVYCAYYPDAGAAGVKTVGLSAPTAQKYTIVAIEVRGAAATDPVATETMVVQNAINRSFYW